MLLSIEIDTKSGDSLQFQIVARIRELILQGRLAPGTRLPSSRDLSSQLKVSRITIVNAFDRLAAEGYLDARGTAGTFVSHQIPERALHTSNRESGTSSFVPQRPTTRVLPRRFLAPLLYQRPRERVEIDFRIGRPSADSFPERIWARLINQKLASAGRRMTEYGNPSGLEESRRAIAQHLRLARGIQADPDQVIVVGGCEEGLNIIAKILAPTGTTVCIENPCYQGAAFVFESYDTKIKAISVDEEGIEVDELPTTSGGLVYVTPSHQFPIGMTMSLSRRLKLLDWATRSGAYIIEDDYDSDFRYDGSPLTALAGLDQNGCVIYVGTFSKSIGAGLRVGYLVVPTELIGAARECKTLLNNGNPWLEQSVIAEFISSGSFDSHLRRIRQLYLRRRNELISSLKAHFGEIEIIGQEGGMHLTWMLPKNFPNARSIQYESMLKGVGVYSIDDGPSLDLGNYRNRERVLLFGYPCLSEEDIRVGVRHIAEAIKSLVRTVQESAA